MGVVRIDFDPEVRAWYLTLSETRVEQTVHVSDDVAVDVDGEGIAVGVEFLIAPAEIEPGVREALFDRFPVVRQALSDIHEAVS